MQILVIGNKKVYNLDLLSKCVEKLLFGELPELQVLVDESRVVLLTVPSRVPAFRDAEPESYWMNLLTQKSTSVTKL